MAHDLNLLKRSESATPLSALDHDENIDKIQSGIDYVDNARISGEAATSDALDLKEDKANKGAANGYAPLGANNKVPDANVNISAANATDLTDGGNSPLHYHATDRDRSNHTGTQAYATIENANTIGAAEYSPLDKVFNIMGSSGVISGCTLTNNGDGSVNIAAGEALIHNSSDELSDLYAITVDEQLNIPIPDDEVTYIYLDWDSGAPKFKTTPTLNNIDCISKCTVYIVYRYGLTHFDYIDDRGHSVDPSRKSRKLFTEFSKFVHVSGGSKISEPAPLALAVTVGAFYYATTEIAHPAFDTSIIGTANENVYLLMYRDGGGGWTRTTDQKLINTELYDDGSGVLEFIGNNKYGTSWVYMLHNSPSHLVVIPGQTTYANQSEADVARPPSEIPDVVAQMGSLLGFVTYEKGDTTFSNVFSAFSTVFTASQATSHNGLPGLQGGALGEYFHLTEDEATNIPDLLDGGDTTLHYHISDRDRANHTGTQTMSTISDAGTSATRDVGTGSGEVAAGDYVASIENRVSDLEPDANIFETINQEHNSTEKVVLLDPNRKIVAELPDSRVEELVLTSATLVSTATVLEEFERIDTFDDPFYITDVEGKVINSLATYDSVTTLEETVTTLEETTTALEETTTALEETVTTLEETATTLEETVTTLEETVTTLEETATTLEEFERIDTFDDPFYVTDVEGKVINSLATHASVSALEETATTLEEFERIDTFDDPFYVTDAEGKIVNSFETSGSTDAKLDALREADTNLSSRMDNGLTEYGDLVSPFVNRWSIRECRMIFRNIKFGLENQCVIVLLGDSFTIGDYYHTKFAKALQDEYGFAGMGWVSFMWHGDPLTGTWDSENQPLPTHNVTTARGDLIEQIKFFGTWSSVYNDYNGNTPNINYVYTSEVGAYTKFEYVDGHSSANLYYTGDGTGVIAVSWDDGVSYSDPIYLDTVGADFVALPDVPAGSGYCRIKVVAGNVAISGVDMQSDSPGVRVHLLGAGGSTAGDWASVNASVWASQIQTLGGNSHSIMLGTNDQGDGYTPDQFAENIQAMITNIRLAFDLNDFALSALPNTTRTWPSYKMEDYAKALRQLAVDNGYALIDFQYMFGVNAEDYSYDNPLRPWYASDEQHPNAATGGTILAQGLLELYTKL